MKKSRIKRVNRKAKAFPTPAFLPGLRGSAAWHVRPIKEGETPHTVNRAGGEAEMALPAGDSDMDKYTKLHELLHAAHSPVEEPRPLFLQDGSYLGVRALLIAEEFRINIVARKLLGGGYNVPQDDKDWWVNHGLELLEGYQKSHAGSALVEFLHWIIVVWPMQPTSLGTWPRIMDDIDVLKKEDRNQEYYSTRNITTEMASTILLDIWAAEITALNTDETIPSWDSVLKLAHYLQEVENMLNPAQDPSAEGGSEGDSEPEDADIAEARERMESHAGKPEAGEILQDKVRGVRQKMMRPGWDSDEKVQWGTMKMRMAKMKLRLPKNKLRRSKHRATDEGANPRFPHRLLTDGKVFSRKRKVPGGSVLIDDSGSMSWTIEQLVAIIEAAPASTIAAYSGAGSTGELVIVADDGKYADVRLGENHPRGGGNVIDAPALEWLAGQPKPRIWVSDTYVIPAMGDPREAFEECMELVRDFDINICFTIEEAKQVFHGERELLR